MERYSMHPVMNSELQNNYYSRQEESSLQNRREDFNPRREAVAMKRRNENPSYDVSTKKRIAHTASWSSTPTTCNCNKSTVLSDTKARVVNSLKQHSVDDKKDAMLSDEKEIFKVFIKDPVMQMKLLLSEFRKRKRDNEEIFYISDNTDKSKISEAVFCFEKENKRCLYQGKYYSHESRFHRKISCRMLRSAEFNLGPIYEAFRSIRSCHRIILCSNLEFNEESLRKNNIRIFDNKSHDTRSIEVQRESKIFKKLVVEQSPFYKLAEFLDKRMRNGREVKVSGIMEKFHVMLVKECVFNITQNMEKKFIARFHEKFIRTADEGLKPVIAQLRRYLKDFNNGELLTNNVLKVSSDFGKESNSTIGQTHSANEITDEVSIKEFFKKLEFMTLIERVDCRVEDIGETFERIQTEFHVEQLNNELFEILQRGKNQANLFQSLERKILCCELMNYHRKKTDEEIKLEFEENSLESLRRLLMESRESTILLKSDNPRLCAFKLQHLIESMPHEYPEGRYFFLDIDELLSAKQHLLTVLAADLKYLLIVQTDAVDLKNEQVKYCVKDIRQRISNAPNGNSKMVIIQNVNDPTLELNFDVIGHKEIFNNQAKITKNTQDKLSEFHCNYCNHDESLYQKISLKELILQPDDLADVLNSAQCVNELVKGKLILGEKLTKPCNFDTTYIEPIARRLNRYIQLNSAVIKKENNDVFVISGFGNQTKGKNVHYYGDREDAQRSFDTITMKNRKLNVHLLKYTTMRDSNYLVWQKSSRSVSALRKYVEHKDVAVPPESIGNVLARRIVIVCGKPYSGKSYYLFQMAYNLLLNNKDLEDWVVQVNLSNSVVDQYADSSLNSSDEAVNLLTKILGYDELRCRLFHLSASGKLKMKLSIFVDGLEELSDNNVSKVSEILRLLSETKIKRICVATRPKFQKRLERALDDFAFNLESMSYGEKKNFLLNMWLSLADENVVNKTLCDSADKIFKSFESLIIKCEPLHLHIFALVCWPYMNNGQDLPSMRRINDIYTEYFDKFLNNLEISKRNRFCMYRLLSPEVIRKLNFHEEERFGEEYRKLNHSSFAEYGVAKWLASLPLDDQITALNIMQDLVTRVSNIFYQTFTYNYEISYAVYIERIGDNRLVIDLFTRHLWNEANDQQRLGYLRTALIYSEELFKVFLNKLNDTGSSQILEHGEFCHQEYARSSLVQLLNKEKLILEAAERNKIDLTCELILKGADISELPPDLVERTASYVVTKLLELEPNQTHPYWSIVESLLKKAPQVTAHFNEEVQLPRLLSYFFAHGRLEVVRKILKTLGVAKKEKLLSVRVDNRTPLDIVNSSALMTDEQRLHITEFLMNCRNHIAESTLFSVMTAAAKCRHVRCFEFFAGGSDRERLSKFFKRALKSNQLDVLAFLLNSRKWTVDYNCARNQPLHTAVVEGASMKTLKFLIGRDVNNQNSNGETALTLAFKEGVDLRIVKFLVSHGADPNARDNRGLAAWYYAILADWCSYSPEQQIELMRFLKQKNIQPLVWQPHQTYEMSRWDKEIKGKFKYLWNRENFNLNSDGTMPRLHSALRGNDFVWFNFLLQHGADPNVLDSKHRSALHIAVGMKNDENLINSVRQLLRHGAVFNAVNENRHMPIIFLRKCKNSMDYKGEAYKLLYRAEKLFECISLVTEELSSVRDDNSAHSSILYWLLYCRDSNKRTLLHRAAQQSLPHGDLKKLLEFGELYGRKSIHRGWINACDINGDTAAHEAARLGNTQMLRELARRGACLDLKNSKDETPLDLAREPVTHNTLETARNLFAKLGKGSLEMSLLTSSRYFCANIRDEKGRSLLHLATSGHGLFLKWGGNLDAQDDEGRRPLHYTVKADNLEATKLLIKAGASLDARDARGWLPADFPPNPDSNSSAELVYRLNRMLDFSWRNELAVDELEARIDSLREKFHLEPSIAVNARDRRGNSMVHHAVSNCDLQLLEVLLKRGAVYNARNVANRSPMDLAEGEEKELLSAIDRLFENPKIELWEANKDVVGLEVMLQCRKVGGYTLFHAVLENGKFKEAKWLMDMGADINVTNDVGASARKLAEGFQLVEEAQNIN